MAKTYAVADTGDKNDGGAILHAGNVGGSRHISVDYGTGNGGGTNGSVSQTQYTGVESVFKTSTVALTSVADNGSGKCRFTKNGHGLSVGNVLYVTGSTAQALQTIHVITAKTTNTFDTDVNYTASATAGNYQLTSGNFNVTTKNKYVIRTVSDELAGLANDAVLSPGSADHTRRPIHYLNSARRLNVTGWNRLTGAATKGANAGVSYDQHNIRGSGPIDDAVVPTKAVPGELTYMKTGAIPTQDEYQPKTM